MIFPGFPGVLSFFQVFQVEWEPCGFSCLYALSPAHNGFLRFTSGATPADLLAVEGQYNDFGHETFIFAKVHIFKIYYSSKILISRGFIFKRELKVISNILNFNSFQMADCNICTDTLMLVPLHFPYCRRFRSDKNFIPPAKLQFSMLR